MRNRREYPDWRRGAGVGGTWAAIVCGCICLFVIPLGYIPFCMSDNAFLSSDWKQAWISWFFTLSDRIGIWGLVFTIGIPSLLAFGIAGVLAAYRPHECHDSRREKSED